MSASTSAAVTFVYDAYTGTVTQQLGAVPLAVWFDGPSPDADQALCPDRSYDYDSAAAHFLSRDPLAAQTREPYAYSADDPINNTDPLGLFAVGVCGTGTLGINGLGPVGGAATGAHCDVVAWGPRGVQVGVIDTVGGGPGVFGGHFASGSKSVLISPTAQTLNDLGGRFQYVSGGFGYPLGPIGFGGEAGYAWGTNACGQAQSVYTFGPSVSFPFGASVTGGVTITVVHPGSLGALSDIWQQFNDLIRNLGL